ncbi:uncharacterized protein [Narcine bancroftii]|uniref:uncharacterized protein n=1 Tax=Narcine bancroftii TaxID=1343680 RepID=UPI00383182CF
MSTSTTQSTTSPPTSTSTTQSTTSLPTSTSTTQSTTSPPTSTSTTQSTTSPPTSTGTTQSTTSPPTSLSTTQSTMSPPTSTSTTQSTTSPPTSTSTTQSTTSPPMSTSTTQSTTSPPTSTSTTQSTTSPPMSTSTTQSTTSPPTSTSTTQSTTSSTSTSTIQSTTSPPTSTGTTQSTTSPPTSTSATQSTISSPTTARSTQPSNGTDLITGATKLPAVLFRNPVLLFSIMEPFNESLNDPSTPQFKALARRVERGLDQSYRNVPGFSRSKVNSFSEGSIQTNSTLFFDNLTIAPSDSEVIKIFAEQLENRTTLEGLAINRSTIQSGDKKLDNVDPISLTISYVIENRVFNSGLNNSASNEFTNLRNSVVTWLEKILISVFGQGSTSNYTVTFRDNMTMVKVTAEVEVSTIIPENRTMLRDLLIRNISDSGFDIDISSIQVNGLSLPTDKFQIQLRYMNIDFSNELSDRGSTLFQNLSTRTTNTVNNIYRSNPEFLDVVVIGFENGSVLSNVVLNFQPNTSTKDEVIQTLANNSAQFRSMDLMLDVNHLTNTTAVPSTTTSTTASTSIARTSTASTSTASTSTASTSTASTSATVNQPAPGRPFPGYAVAIIIMCGLAILSLPFLIVLFIKTGYCSKVANAFRLESPDHLDLTHPIFEDRSYNFN